jgi:hypothetical protein
MVALAGRKARQRPDTAFGNWCGMEYGALLIIKIRREYNTQSGFGFFTLLFYLMV